MQSTAAENFYPCFASPVLEGHQRIPVASHGMLEQKLSASMPALHITRC